MVSASSFVLVLGLLLDLTAARSINCPSQPVPHKPEIKGAHCRAPGLADGGELESFQSTSGNYSDCYQNCVYSSLCYSFSYRPKKKECRLFEKDLKGQHFKPKKGTGEFFWDLETCFDFPGSCRTISKIPDDSFEWAPRDSPWAGSNSPVTLCNNYAVDGSCFDIFTLPDELGPYLTLQQDYLPTTNGVQYNFTYYYQVPQLSLARGEKCEFSSGLSTDTGLVEVQTHLPITKTTSDWVVSPILLYTPQSTNQPSVLFKLNCTSTASNATLYLDYLQLVKVDGTF